MPRVISPKTITIASGTSLSPEIDLGGMDLYALGMPAAWTTANLTIQAAATTGGTFQDVYDDAGTEVSLTAVAGHMVIIGSAMKNLAAFRFLKLRSGTGGSPVNQAADRSLTLFLRDG